MLGMGLPESWKIWGGYFFWDDFGKMEWENDPEKRQFMGSKQIQCLKIFQYFDFSDLLDPPFLGFQWISWFGVKDSPYLDTLQSVGLTSPQQGSATDPMKRRHQHPTARHVGFCWLKLDRNITVNECLQGLGLRDRLGLKFKEFNSRCDLHFFT